MPVRKAVIPAAGLGTRFLPATKAQPKEMLPVVDKPAIQYVVEEAVRAGIDDILIVTGRGKRTIEDHFDRSFELEYYLRAEGQVRRAEAGACDRRDGARSTTSASAIPSAWGTRSRWRRSTWAGEPFAVLLGDDLIHRVEPAARRDAPGPRAVRPERHRRAGGPAATRSTCTVRRAGIRRGQPGPRRVDRREANPADAPSNLAAIGRYVLTPEIFDALREIEPGRGRRDPAHRRHQPAGEGAGRLRYMFEGGRYDIGNKLDYLKATVESPSTATTSARSSAGTCWTCSETTGSARGPAPPSGQTTR